MVRLKQLQTHETTWHADTDGLQVTLNLTLDGCIVPSEVHGARVDKSHVVVLDDLISDVERQELLDWLTEAGWDHTQGPPESKWERATCDAAFLPRTWGLQAEMLQRMAQQPPKAMVEVQSRLCKLYPDMAIAHMPSEQIQSYQAASVGQEASLQQDHGCKQHTPGPSASTCIQSHAESAGYSGNGRGCQPKRQRTTEQQAQGQPQTQLQLPSSVQPHDTAYRQAGTPGSQPGASAAAANAGPASDVSAGSSSAAVDDDDHGTAAVVDCNPFVANAAVHGDSFSWHVDADPWDLPESAWTQGHGHYFNREPGKPLFVSLLLYLNDAWPREWDAETLVLDAQSDTGLIIRPRPGRALLMDQDVLHRVSAPSRLAGRPRYLSSFYSLCLWCCPYWSWGLAVLAPAERPWYSLVWKLVFLPKQHGQQCCIARPEWGRPIAFGSAAKLAQAARHVMLKQTDGQQEGAQG